ncbi:MAG TPA: molybdopterin-dependent oxidoreductase [Kofleriaceae bacterium]|jgi:anaerobic selenocysteine-containing dehydrogenase|nr:molybdopterin-dependent oxidoreductase [Kofleriaceae bacterium]
METRSSACPLDCPDLCGLTVTVDGGRVIEVNGDRRGPLTDGFICGKVRKIADHLYGEDRLTTPLVQTGPKGSGRWTAISWDDALDRIAHRLTEIRGRAGGEAILPYHYGGSNGWITEGGLADRLFRRLGASNLDRTFCAAATTAAVRGLYGAMPGTALEDYAHAKLIVLWGVNPSATSIHLVPVIERAREAGAKLVVFDPRKTPLARRADLHLPLRPGTDLPVALAMIHALFERGHADRGFLAAHAAEVDALSARAARWSIADAAREAEIDPALLDQAVELYAQAAPAVIRVGWGLERNRNGGSAAAAIMALPAVAGKLGVRGGGFTMSNGDARWTASGAAGVAEPATDRRTINMSELAGALRTVRDPKIECLFVYNCNPVATAPDQRGVIEQLARDDLFVVVHDQVMTDTARLADLVLPATAFLEHREIRRGYGTMRMFDSPAVATPPGEARSNTQLFGALLERLGLVRPGDPMTDEAIAAAIFAASPHGPALRAQLDADRIATPPDGPRLIPFADAFPGTPDQKIHLVPEALDREAPYGLYTYQPDPRTDAYPLALISPALATQISSTFGQLRKAPAQLELSPGDAAARDIATGDRVRVWNALGEVECVAKVAGEVRDGVCVLAKGYWRRHTANGFTANALIPADLADLGGQAAYNDARVQVAKAAYQRVARP